MTGREFSRARARGATAGADALRGARGEEFAGLKRFRRYDFPTSKRSLVDRSRPFTLTEKLRLERWART
jgi:hypothetical protein